VLVPGVLAAGTISPTPGPAWRQELSLRLASRYCRCVTNEPSPSSLDRDSFTPPFVLPEYEQAFVKFTSDILKLLSGTKDPILGRMQRARPHRMYLGRNSLPSGQVHEGTSMPVRAEFSLQATEIVAGNAEVLWLKWNELADEYVASLMPQIFAAIASATEAAGTNINAGGQPLSADLFIEMLERMQLDFDDNGQLNLQMVVGPDFVPPPQSEEDQRRIDEFIERKRQEFFAKRRRRELPGHPLRA